MLWREHGEVTEDRGGWVGAHITLERPSGGVGKSYRKLVFVHL